MSRVPLAARVATRACARALVDPAAVPALNRALLDFREWPALDRLLTLHRLRPLAYRLMQAQCAERVPPVWLDRWGEAARATACHNLLLPRSYERYYHYIYRRSGVGGMPLPVELHWHLKAEGTCRPAIAPLWRHARQRPSDLGPVWGPDEVDRLIHLALHCAHHGFAPLLLQVDIARLLRQSPELDWRQLVARARLVGAWVERGGGPLAGRPHLTGALSETLLAVALEDTWTARAAFTRTVVFPSREAVAERYGLPRGRLGYATYPVRCLFPLRKLVRGVL